jgi:hypothetical protein
MTIWVPRANVRSIWVRDPAQAASAAQLPVGAEKLLELMLAEQQYTRQYGPLHPLTKSAKDDIELFKSVLERLRDSSTLSQKSAD